MNLEIIEKIAEDLKATMTPNELTILIIKLQTKDEETTIH